MDSCGTCPLRAVDGPASNELEGCCRRVRRAIRRLEDADAVFQTASSFFFFPLSLSLLADDGSGGTYLHGETGDGKREGQQEARRETVLYRYHGEA